MKAYLVDPEKQTIEEVTTAYPELKTLLGCEYITTLTVVKYPWSNATHDSDVLYLDDESLLKDDPGAVWTVSGYDGHLCGRGMLVGINGAGEDCKTPCMSIDTFRSLVVFKPHMMFDKIETVPAHDEYHPQLGKVFVTGTRSLFKNKNAE